MHTLLQDVRYALRMLRKNPGATAIAVLALALGIGATSTIFSTVDAVLLRPLAYKDLNSLVVLWGTIPKQNIIRSSVTPADFLDWSEHNRSFSDMAAVAWGGANLTGQGEPQRVEGSLVTANYFDVLGVHPIKGRALLPADCEYDARVVVLAHRFWTEKLGADPNIVGKLLNLNGQNHEVIGVMAPEVEQYDEDMWRPLAFSPAVRADRKTHKLRAYARLRPGVTLQAAQAEMQAITARLAEQYPQTNTGTRARVSLLRDDMTFGTRQYVLTLLGSAFFVLLLACANVANLQLARALARQKEMAVRAALGASRWRVVRQLLVESTLIACGGGIFGLLLTVWGVDISRAGVPPSIIRIFSMLGHIEVNFRVVAFTSALAIGSGLLSGLFAALHASRADMNEALKEAGRSDGAGSGRHPMRAVLVGSEVALALVLLVGAGLMIRGFRNLFQLNQGYDPAGVLTLRVSLPEYKYHEENKRAAFYDEALRGLQSMPNVEAAAIATYTPVVGAWTDQFRIEGRPEPAPGERMVTDTNSVTPDYLRVMRVPLLKGRWFTPQDGRDTTPVAVISESLAHRYWPNEDPINRRIRTLGTGAPTPWTTVVGVVADIAQNPFDRATGVTAATTYLPITQVPTQSAAFLVRTPGDPVALAVAAQAQIHHADSDQPIYEVRSMQKLLGDMTSGVMYSARTMAVFAFIALALAAAGIYAVMAYSVVQRTHEIGVRMALGAGRGNVLRMIVGSGLRISIIGLVIGGAMALGLAKLLSSVLFGVLGLDALTIAGLMILLAAVAAAASYVPARRASKVDPMVALRYE